MSRISIKVTPEEQQKLKVAATQKKSIKDNVIGHTVGAPCDKHHDTAFPEIESLLDKRANAAKNGAVSKRTVGDIFQAAYRQAKRKAG